MSPKTASGQRKRSIRFVNAWPSSESERLRTESLVRAHVGQWNASQAIQQDDTGDDVEDQSTLPSPSKPARLRDTRTKSLTPTRRKPTGHGGQQNMGNQIQFLIRRTPLSKDPLSSKLDPFSTYTSRLPRDLIQFGQHLFLSVILPNLSPGRPSAPGAPATKAAISHWTSLFLRNPVIPAVCTYISLCHWRISCCAGRPSNAAFAAKIQSLHYLCELNAIEYINKMLRDPAAATSDIALFAVLCLIIQAPANANPSYRPSPFRAPLQDAQLLRVYGVSNYHFDRVGGLEKMLEMRGGLDNIQFPGLAPWLCYRALIRSTMRLIKPPSSYIPADKNHEGLTLQELFGFSSFDVKEAFGQFRAIGFTEKMTEVFHGMHVYMTYIHDYLQGSTRHSDPSLIHEQRNLLQFSIISLPPVSDILGFHQDPRHAIIYESSRLAALIYGAGVIIPIPSKNSPLPQLARLIQACLINTDTETIWDTPPARVALFWILTLGGIAAESLPERVWFVEKLGYVSRVNYCCCWPDLRNLLGFMPWYGPACDPAARLLWDEVEVAFRMNAMLPIRCCADPGDGGSSGSSG